MIWLNDLFTKCENTAEAYLNDDHLRVYILPVRAPQFYSATAQCFVGYHASFSSSSVVKRINARRTEIKFD